MQVHVSGPEWRRSGGRCLIFSILAIVLLMVVINVAAPLLVTGMFLGGPGIRSAGLATQVGITRTWVASAAEADAAPAEEHAGDQQRRGDADYDHEEHDRPGWRRLEHRPPLRRRSGPLTCTLDRRDFPLRENPTTRL